MATELSLRQALDIAIKALVEKKERNVFAVKTVEAEDGGKGRLTPEIKKDYARYQVLLAAENVLRRHRGELREY